MNIVEMNIQKSILAAICVFFSIVAAAQTRPLPKNTYDCQVLAKTGVHALAQVQADTEAEAREVAGRADVEDMGGRPSEVLSVVECVDRRSGTLTDSTFRRYTEQLDR